jgi:hypothetical protein
MREFFAELFKQPVAREPSKDTGMAMVLLLLLASATFKRQELITSGRVQASQR